MLKVIELDIDPEITGETGVWEVAWVEMPAIEQELIYFSKQRFFKAPEYVSETACRAIRENEERGNPAGTQVGKIRAQQLCKRDEISLETVKRMKSFLERAKTYYTGNYDDKGTIAYDLWGGENALKWVDTILKSQQNFVYPEAGETKDEFLGRCMGENKMVDEYPDESQRYAVCNSYYERTDEFALDKVSFDWDGTLTTAIGKKLLKQELTRGNLVYIISARSLLSSEMLDLAREFNIPATKIFTTGSNPRKIEKIRELGIVRHYDDNPNVLRELGTIGQRFDYDTGGLPPYTSYPESGATNAMLVEPILPPTLFEQCGCGEYAEVGERGAIRESEKAPKSDTPNPNPQGQGTARGDASTTRGAEVTERVEKILQEKSDDFNERYKDKLGYGVNVGMLKSVYQRGVGAYNTSHSPNVSSAEQWALARVNAFLYIVKEGRPENSKYVGDNDLLPKDHPKYSKKEEFELVGYIDGQPIFSTPEEAEEYGQKEMGCSGHHTHTDEDGNEVYMPCSVHPEVDEDMGVELEDLIAKGWKIESIGPVQNIEALNTMAKEAFSKITKEEFYVIKSNPNGFSALDTPGGNKVRFIYAVGPGMGAKLIKTSREFCKRMLGGRQFVFRYEDILELNAQIFAQDSTSRKIIPRPKGTDPDIFQWKGGANCRHIWIQLIFSSGNPDEGYTAPLSNDIPKMTRDAAMVSPLPGQGGNVNPKARTVKGDRMDAFSSEKMSEYWDDPELIPVGYIQGLPVFDDLVDAQDASYFLNCGGVTEEVDFMGTRKFQACSYSAKQAEKQEQVFKSIEEKRMVYTPLMIPNILIPRLDDVTGERYYVKFKPEVIEKIQQKFMIEQRLRETNYEHTDVKFKDIVMVESWLVDGDSDKAYSLGFTKQQIPQGTWMAGYKFLDTEEANMVWENYVKKGKVKGASVEGNFILNFSREKKDEYLLSEIINILKKIK